MTQSLRRQRLLAQRMLDEKVRVGALVDISGNGTHYRTKEGVREEKLAKVRKEQEEEQRRYDAIQRERRESYVILGMREDE